MRSPPPRLLPDGGLGRRPRSSRDPRTRDDRGEALPAAILFIGVLLVVLLGIHVVIIAMARTAVQAAAEAAASAAQVAGPGRRDCFGDPTILEPARECEAVRAAQLAMAGARASVTETRRARVLIEGERGLVTVLVFGSTRSPIFGQINLAAQACAPLDDAPAAQFAGANPWQC